MPIETSATTGFREFCYERYAAVVVWLCRELDLVTTTSLNKLLFYVDFLHFKSEAVSITGATYVHLDLPGASPLRVSTEPAKGSLDFCCEFRIISLQRLLTGQFQDRNQRNETPA